MDNLITTQEKHTYGKKRHVWRGEATGAAEHMKHI